MTGAAGDRTPPASGTATYLYAITRPLSAQQLAGVRGVDGAAVRVLAHQGLHCLISTVPLTEFGESALQRNLGDLEWLERTARAHDVVVRAASAVATTAPLRLATVVRGDKAAMERLSALAAPASALLDRLDGRIEWGIKVFGVPRSEGAGSTTGPADVGTRTGTAYLRRRRAETLEREQESTLAADLAEAVYRELAAAAVAGRRHQPQDPALTGIRDPMLLNAAFLVDRTGSERFRDVAHRLGLARPRIRVDLTGPWPPYSFATLEQA